ncbi:Ribosome maturation factor rimP [Desulfotomaculum nigrificans CO-1-SRB]|uniref:Ribosome maturation factor RimP n=1 Tax=Desulfotomaculum nigrificans (strain DSM 14880 / VKM B-2319 / CO-1-SRB) TaxID=868595 RepID=F6B633_DESCC|nr:ribosome maturation factor RimP [Desulfotomaculum nigrificans]AEF94352.1 Ribosome maturation factor rimP [Desulfotomaculum nigrificans CO-1-SRB]
MAKNSVVEKVTAAIEPIVEESKLELVNVEYVKEGGNWYLRVFIDKPGGVDLDDCQMLSEKLDKLLDELDPIPQAYFLEVSSPGIERPLKKPEDFERFMGHLVNITTYTPIDGAKSFTGKLQGYTEAGIEIEVKGKPMLIPHDRVATSRLAVEF